MQCRVLELGEMMKSVSEPDIGGGKRVMQLLPRHMRRRAANHDVRRLPLKRRLEGHTDVCSIAPLNLASSTSVTSFDECCWSGVRGNINRTALVTVVLCKFSLLHNFWHTSDLLDTTIIIAVCLSVRLSYW